MNGKGTVRYCYAIATGILIVSGMAFKAPLVHADTIDFKAFDDARRLSDKELADMRGRFVDGNRIIAFGLSMTSLWSNNGEHLSAGLDFQANLSGTDPSISFTPHLTAYTRDDYQQITQHTAGNGANVTNLGTANGHGIVQTIQAGGDGNGVLNDFRINIQSASLDNKGGGNGKYYLESDSGAFLSVEQGKNGMATSIIIPDKGVINQQIVPNLGLHQNVSLQSNYQQIRNITQLNIQMGESMHPMAGQARQALESLRGLRR